MLGSEPASLLLYRCCIAPGITSGYKTAPGITSGFTPSIRTQWRNFGSGHLLAKNASHDGAP